MENCAQEREERPEFLVGRATLRPALPIDEIFATRMTPGPPSTSLRELRGLETKEQRTNGVSSTGLGHFLLGGGTIETRSTSLYPVQGREYREREKRGELQREISGSRETKRSFSGSREALL